jgi:hypothetical protein
VHTARLIEWVTQTAKMSSHSPGGDHDDGKSSEEKSSHEALFCAVPTLSSSSVIEYTQNDGCRWLRGFLEGARISMAFWFQGVFALASDKHSARQLMEAAQTRWPAAAARLVEHPFFGVGIHLPETAMEDTAMEAELPAWSLQFPQTTFVYLKAECFGGVCEYRGSVCRHGEVLLREEREDGGIDVLQHLLAPLGVTLDSRGYFAPLERGFFDADTFSA